MFVSKDFVRGRFVIAAAEIRAGCAYFRDELEATQSKILFLATRPGAYERCTYHQNHVYNVLAQTVETTLRYLKKRFQTRKKGSEKSQPSGYQYIAHYIWYGFTF